MSDNKNQNNDFLNEIQEKINKRSGGLYYNKKLKSIKKNLSITSFVVVFIIVLWALINFVYQKVSLSSDIKATNKSLSKVINKNKSKSKANKPIPKQKYRYVFTPSKNFDSKNSIILKNILRKYTKNEGKDFYIYLIPETEIKGVLKLILNIKLTLKKESYKDLSDKYQISIKKEILK